MRNVNLYVVQLLQDKKLNGLALTIEEQEYLDRYEEASNDLFAEWLEAAY